MDTGWTTERFHLSEAEFHGSYARAFAVTGHEFTASRHARLAGHHARIVLQERACRTPCDPTRLERRIATEDSFNLVRR